MAKLNFYGRLWTDVLDSVYNHNHQKVIFWIKSVLSSQQSCRNLDNRCQGALEPFWWYTAARRFTEKHSVGFSFSTYLYLLQPAVMYAPYCLTNRKTSLSICLQSIFWLCYRWLFAQEADYALRSAKTILTHSDQLPTQIWWYINLLRWKKEPLERKFKKQISFFQPICNITS